MSPVAEEDERQRLASEIAGIFDECHLSPVVHHRKLRELASLAAGRGGFAQAFSQAICPLLDFRRRTSAAERVVRFVAAFAASPAARGFLEEFLGFLVLASAAAGRAVRTRACQIISEILVRLPDDAEVSDEIWSAVVDAMKMRADDQAPAVREFAVQVLSHFVSDADTGILELLLERLDNEQNAEVRKSMVLALPASDSTLEAIVESTLDVSEAVRKTAYNVLAAKFPIQSLSIKQRATLLQRGLSDRSASVSKECLRMLKDEWLLKCCGADIITLLRFLDVETYESISEAALDALWKEGMVTTCEGCGIEQYLDFLGTPEGEPTLKVQLMDAEVALYWKVVCRHLQADAEAKGSEAASTRGMEAAVYASEASDKNDLLERVLPRSTVDYVVLVEAHLSAGANYRFASRQLLLLGGILDFSDSANRKTASEFVHGLLTRSLEYEVDDDGNKFIMGDGLSLGGDPQWASAVLKLAKKVHASRSEFEGVITDIISELALPCRERAADFLHWMHCLALSGLLLENITSLSALHGVTIELSLLHSLLLPGARHIHVDVQRVALRSLCLYGLLEKQLSAEIVKQLRLSFIIGPHSVSVMACKALFDLVTWHGPEVVDDVVGVVRPESDNSKSQFTPVNFDESTDDLNLGVLDLLFSGFGRHDQDSCDSDDHGNVLTVLGEGFAKLLILSENYPSISTDMHSLMLAKVIRLYFLEETKELGRLKQQLSVFFHHYAALSQCHKGYLLRAFIPVMRNMWPGLYGNSSGASIVVSKMRKSAIQASQFMLKMLQAPLVPIEPEDKGTKSSDSPSGVINPSDTFDTGEEGLGIHIAAEVIGCPEKKTPAGRAYISALCKIVALLNFRQSEQKAVKCMRGLLNTMMALGAADRDAVKELATVAAHLRTLDEQPSDGMPPEEVDAILAKLGLECNFNVDVNMDLPPTPMPCSTRPPVRRRTKRQSNSNDDSDSGGSNMSLAKLELAQGAPVTPAVTAMRSQRASKTAAMSKLTATARARLEPFDSDDDVGEGVSDVTDDTEEEDSDESS